MQNVKSSNKIIIFGLLALVIVVALIISYFFVFNKKTVEVSIEDSLVSVGKDFYENYYYDLIDNKEDLNIFAEIGLNFNLANIDQTINLDDKVKRKFEKEKCDFAETRVLIYPEKPFNNKDYTIKVILSCEK